ncbi:uncharacterized protein FFM5_15129 [Fusarium fujikuroi]|nr:uncharacterized protein FFM5_15129 [Fusarium fujikuroi]
MRPLYINTT